MNSVVLAGGEMAKDDPLYAESQQGSRSLITLLGKPMVQWVIDALDASSTVAELYVIGLQPNVKLRAEKPLHYLPDQGTMLENIRYGMFQSGQDHPERKKVIIASSDIPAIRPHMVDWLANQVAEDPSQMIYYNVISREVMEARFRNANRSYVRFKDVAVCGGDLNAIDLRAFSSEQPLWQELTSARKHPLKQASLVGIDTLLLVALRMITLDGAVKKVCRKLALQGKALRCPYAEMGMDADKPHQLAILRQYLQEGL